MKYPIYILILLLTLTSCEKLLEEQPFTETATEFFYETKEDALSSLTAAYARLKSGNGYYRQKFISSVFAASDQGQANFVYGDFKRGTIVNTDQNLPATWREIYVGVRDANNVIAHVPGIDMDVELRARIIGEAKFLRALHYFNLVRCWGEVPLRTEPVGPDDEGLPVSPITDIYEVIISDLQDASANCWGRLAHRNGETNDLGRVTKAAAHALLAKVYLRIASAKRTALDGIDGNEKYRDFSESPEVYYQLAKVQCDSVLAQDGFQLVTNLSDWADLFDASNGNNPEMLLDVQGSSIAGEGTAVSNLFCPRDAGLSGGGWGGSNKLLPNFINSSLDKADTRYINSIIHEYQNITKTYVLIGGLTGYNITWTDTGNASGTLWQVWTGKYIDTEATTEYTSQQNWHIIRLADVHLMRAEAMAEISQDPGQANEDFNILRTRVEMPEFNGTGMSMEEFRNALLRERAAELYMEGHRFFDITRMGVYDEYCRITYGPTDGARQPEDYFWPIPLSEIAANGNIEGP